MLLIDKIKNTREISENSLNTYNNNLRKLYKLITGNSKEELKEEDMEKEIELLSKLAFVKVQEKKENNE